MTRSSADLTRTCSTGIGNNVLDAKDGVRDIVDSDCESVS